MKSWKGQSDIRIILSSVRSEAGRQINAERK